jgi:hypothetical protein
VIEAIHAFGECCVAALNILHLFGKAFGIEVDASRHFGCCR